MLSVDSLNAAMPLTSVLDSNNLVFVPVVGTPLEALVNATRSDINFSAETSPGEYQPDIASIEYIANAKNPVLNVSRHDIVMDEIVEKVATAVKEHISFAKNVVTPAIEELVNKTQATLQSLTPSVLLGMEVIVYNPPKPMLSSGLEDAVRKFQELPFDIPVLNMNLPALSSKEIIELMQSGSGNLDSYIAEWAAEKGDTFFINLWSNVFQITPVGLNATKVITFRDYIYDNEQGIDNALGIYLLARRLADKALPNTEMSLASFNKTIIEFRNQAAARLCLAFDELNKVDKIQQLVRSYDKYTITVNGSVYRKWIEAGGDNEILFGNLLELPCVVTVDEINIKAAALKTSWNRYATLTATVERNKLFVRTKEVLLKNFIDIMRVITEGEEATVANRELIIKLFNEQLERVREDELANIWDVCLKLICRSRFFRTEAERILLGIERVKKENPNIDIREAATVSTMEYISYWLSTQMKIQAA